MAPPKGWKSPRKGKPGKDPTGLRRGRLVVIGFSHTEFSEKHGRGWSVWKCRCDCGNFDLVDGNEITRKRKTGKQSCGCLRLELNRKQALEITIQQRLPGYVKTKKWFCGECKKTRKAGNGCRACRRMNEKYYRSNNIEKVRRGARMWNYKSKWPLSLVPTVELLNNLRREIKNYEQQK